MSPTQPKISRVTRSKKQAKSSYNRLSRWYDLVSGSSEWKISEKALRMLEVKEGEKVLEIGFGTGKAILDLAKSVGISGKVYGIDISEGMFNITQARVYKASLSNRVKLSIGDAIKLPFNDHFFNAIFISFTLELFDTPEIPLLLNECLKVLQNGGRICVVALSKKDSPLTKLYELAHRLFPSFLDCRPIYVRQAVKDVGFHITEITEISMWGLPVEIVIAKKGKNNG